MCCKLQESTGERACEKCPRVDIRVTATKTKQERTTHNRTKISPFSHFRLHFLIFLLEIFSIASQLSCEAIFTTSNKNIEKCGRKSKKIPILVLS